MNIKYLIFIPLVFTFACRDNVDTNMGKILEEVNAGRDNIVITKQQFESSEYKIGKMERREFDKMLEVTGEIEMPAISKAGVTSYIGGTVGDFNLIEGQWVKKGQVLFQLSNPTLIDMQETLLVEDGKLAYLESEYKRQQDLAQEQITTTKEMLLAKAEWNTAKSRFAAIKQKLMLYGINPHEVSVETLSSSIAIKAPMSGYISSIDIVKGAHLAETETAISIADANHLHLELNVLERDIYLLKVGQQVTYTIAGKTDQGYTAKIHLIQKQLDDSRMVQVHCHLDQESEKDMVDGMYTNAWVHINTYEGWAIAEDAIVIIDDKNYLLSVTNTSSGDIQLIPVEVDLGVKANGYVEIKSTNDQLITSQYLVKGGYYVTGL